MKKSITTTVLIAICGLLLKVLPVCADGYVEHKKSELHASKEKLKQHIKRKLNDKLNIEIIALKQTDHGAAGSIYLTVDPFSQKPVAIPYASNEERELNARKIARKFIEDEKELLGATDFEEIRETYFDSGNDNYGYYTRLSYKRYVNGYNLFTSSYDVTVCADDKICRVSASLIPISQTMYDAAHQKALSEDEIIDIVINDLKSDQKNPRIIQKKPDGTHPFLRMDKLLIDKPPYAVWKIRAAYVYTINAITGEIVDKYLNIKE